jgi:hypothetical protein
MKKCNLCLTREATQENSHIVPRFMGVTILENPDGKRKGFKLDNDPNFLNQKPQQDTPKENYILCPECESIFGKFERKLANEFYYKFKRPEHDKDFPRVFLPNGILRASNKNVDYTNFKLATYGIFFKVSISELPYFNDSRITNGQRERLRQILNNETDFEDISIVLLTSENDQEFTRNYIYAHSYDDHLAHFVWANDYIFFIDFGTNVELIKHFDGIKMNENGLFKIGVLPNQVWDNLRKTLMGFKVNKIKTSR